MGEVPVLSGLLVEGIEKEDPKGKEAIAYVTCSAINENFTCGYPYGGLCESVGIYIAFKKLRLSLLGSIYVKTMQLKLRPAPFILPGSFEACAQSFSFHWEGSCETKGRSLRDLNGTKGRRRTAPTHEIDW